MTEEQKEAVESLPDELPTVTLTDDDIPVVTLIVGHVDAERFNLGFELEGWEQSVPWSSRELTHEYWRRMSCIEGEGKRKDYWFPSGEEFPGAVPVTVGWW